ncbi:MAG: imidazoleglycerol-phosphate dehydratase [Tenericutes bacterium GWC2_34_14]|nr:MAG: imidazoleglycerol-phosphate dehydratase [Tenericutes bacterium GWA2_35_7]OHE29948.1 MAG: imidazoleglycerol-phosphate dehydratase [Tenericutes bacterium GWC2_34_14]OHE34927.1 MAG: imidazoleglycerol-phosphate dehydratase [Tenericutes bacterium GWE2_34_108]OHE37213.1 MAG: imidazoleglycerol-phosphate dehydratase [Tenericutes bacterium GWF1_35_14]OHE39655.1 MAG: imidazoleglycerol-phosphate dehydratase [Tenericutes bacterium GWF2_35_184]OHE44157.1 MAG: imidazoleglycerol-phosphate dehydratase
MRTSKRSRVTKETDIWIELNIDGTRNIDIDTGIPFFDHMLALFAFHGKFDLKIDAKGDLAVDDHHTVEDVGIILGQAFKEAIADYKGINRYGSVFLPMDEALSRVVVDISNRPYLVFNATFKQDKVGTLSTENVYEFFKAFVQEARINCHIELLYGMNDHHKIESIFKGFGRAMKEALKIVDEELPSTKGLL